MRPSSSPRANCILRARRLEKTARVIAGRILEHEKSLEASLEALFGSMRTEA